MEVILMNLVVLTIVTPLVLLALGNLKVPPEGHVALNLLRSAARRASHEAQGWWASRSWLTWTTNSTAAGGIVEGANGTAAAASAAADCSWDEGVIPVPGFFWWDDPPYYSQ
jgi:hypothetical protein